MSNTSSDRLVSTRRHSTTGFTLVELLVVIGIIAVLIGILLPVLGRARGAARTVTCAARMRQLASAVMLYVHDNKGYLPPPALTNDYDLNPVTGEGRYGRPVMFPRGGDPEAIRSAFLRKYLTKDAQQSYVCPELLANVAYTDAQNYSYRYNRILGGDDLVRVFGKPQFKALPPNGGWYCQPWKINRIKQAPLVAMFIDADLETSGQGPGTGNCTFWQDMTVASGRAGSRYHTPNINYVAHQRKKIGNNTGTGKHAFIGMNNVAYCDGSVRGVQVKTDKNPPRAWESTYIEPAQPTAFW